MSEIERRLTELGHTLPEPVSPIATYVPFVQTGNLVHISGQVSVDAKGGVTGVVGEAVDLVEAQRAAELCGLNLIAQMKAACGGDLDRVVRIIKLGGFVQAGPEFFDIPQVINGCST
jgi:enamine deaminase RidA (YjgF/YER057c/UK114 family)